MGQRLMLNAGCLTYESRFGTTSNKPMISGRPTGKNGAGKMSISRGRERVMFDVGAGDGQVGALHASAYR